MTDARLVATNPVDSSLVPVACNSRGELSTQAPTIELIPNDVEITGDLTVTGTINGSGGGGGGQGEKGEKGEKGEPGAEGAQGPQGDPGEGLPLPYAPDGSVLQVVNGAPTWAVVLTPEPEPEPEPEPNIVSTTLFTNYQLRNSESQPVSPPDPLVWLFATETWGDPLAESYEAAWKTFGDSVTTHTDEYTLTDSFGKVLTIGYMLSFKAGARRTYEPLVPSIADQNFSLVANTYTGTLYEQNELAWMGGEASWLVNRDTSTVQTTHQVDAKFMSDRSLILRKYVLEDAGTFALRRQMAFEEKILRLRGITSDIDLSRPTQD